MQKFYKKNKLMIFMGLPALLIFLFFSLGFLNILSSIKNVDIVVISLLIITPIIFFLNGLFSHKFKMNFLKFSIPSYISFTIIFILWLNSSAFSYYFLYLVFNILGYYFYKFDKLIETKKEKKIKQEKFYGKKSK